MEGLSLSYKVLFSSSSKYKINFRIVCFDLDKGHVRYTITNPKMNSVYAIIADENKSIFEKQKQFFHFFSLKLI